MQLSDSEIKQQTRRLWETVFGDSQDFIDLYFSKKYTSAANMVRIEDGAVVAEIKDKADMQQEKILSYTIGQK